ncbi:MAG TPA: hypothetical protein VGH91_08645 [Gammaproteobacteria bacterium]|jgi:hypothetical protein
MKKKPGPKPKRRHGPEGETVKIEGSWHKAVKTALKKTKPAKGWPK